MAHVDSTADTERTHTQRPISSSSSRDDSIASTNTNSKTYTKVYMIPAQEQYVRFFEDNIFSKSLLSSLKNYFSIEAMISDLRENLSELATAYKVILSGSEDQVSKAYDALAKFLSDSVRSVFFSKDVDEWYAESKAVSIIRKFIEEQKIPCLCQLKNDGFTIYYFESDINCFKQICTTTETIHQTVKSNFSSIIITLPEEVTGAGIQNYFEILTKAAIEPSSEKDTIIIRENRRIMVFGFTSIVNKMMHQNKLLRNEYRMDQANVNLQPFQIDYLLAMHAKKLRKLESTYEALEILDHIKSQSIRGRHQVLKKIIDILHELSGKCQKEVFIIDELYFGTILTTESERIYEIGLEYECLVQTEAQTEKRKYETPKAFANDQTTVLRPAALSIDIRLGDLTQQSVDMVVVSSTSRDLMDNILTQAGSSIKDDVTRALQSQRINANGYETGGGDLLCQRLFFLPWTEQMLDKDELRRSIRKFFSTAIQYAMATKQTSLAFPAIGCGRLAYKPKMIADIIIDETERYANYNLEILIVILPEKLEVYDFFCIKLDGLRKSRVTSVQPIISHHHTKMQMAIIGPEHRLKSCFEAIRKHLNSCVSKKDCDEMPLNIWDQATIDQFYRYCLERAVLPDIDSNGNLILQGSREVVADAQIVFYQTKSAKIEEAWVASYSRLAVWGVKVSDNYVEKYPIKSNAYIEHAYANKSGSVKFKNNQKEECTIEFDKMMEICGTNQREVIRSDFELPPNWIHQSINVIRCRLHKDETEYQDVLNLFKKTMRRKYISIDIERIQNRRWFSAYEIHGKYLNLKETEKLLFHGCPETSADMIIHSCFNRSFAGVNGVLYGVGVYFSQKASYSHKYTRSSPINHGQRCMFLAKVLVGNTTLGNKNMKTAPDGFHSTTDEDHIFVTYHDDQAYAAYLIKYTCNDGS